jgi:hypothetical protein
MRLCRVHRRVHYTGAQTCDVLRMKGSNAKVRRHHFFKCETGVIEYRLICVNRSAIRIQHNDHLGYGINNLPELAF